MFENLRNIILDKSEDLINKSNLSKKSVGILLRSFHFAISIVVAILLFTGSNTVFKLAILFNIVVFLMFFIFDGCILSRLEMRFVDDDFTVIDPFLELARIEVTNENRKKYSLYSSIVGFIFTFALYYYRFATRQGHPDNNNITL
jgi:hypothetical protein